MRDAQRARVYAAENAAFPPKSAERLPFKDGAAALAFARRVQKWKWWVTRFGTSVEISVKISKRGAWSWGWCERRWNRRHICVMQLAPSGLDKFTFTHELAHGLVLRAFGYTVQAHGREFAAVYLALMRRIMGRGAVAALTAEFKKHRVKHRSMRLSQAIGKRVSTTSSSRQKAAAGATNSEH